MKNKKGFTLIELLAVIVILGIVITLASYGVSKYLKQSKEKLKEQAAEEIIEVAKAYVTTNNLKVVDIKTLINEGYLEDDVINPTTGKAYDNTNDDNLYIVLSNDCSVKKSYNYGDKYFLIYDDDINNKIEDITNKNEIENIKISESESENESNSYNITYDTGGEKTRLTNLTIFEQIKKMNEENQNKGVLVMSLFNNEIQKIKDELKLTQENINLKEYVLIVDDDDDEIDIVAKNISEADTDNIKFLAAKYIVDIIRENNENEELIKSSSQSFYLYKFYSTLGCSKVDYTIKCDFINPGTGKIDIEDFFNETIMISYNKNYPLFSGIGYNKNGWYYFDGYQLSP